MGRLGCEAVNRLVSLLQRSDTVVFAGTVLYFTLRLMFYLPACLALCPW